MGTTTKFEKVKVCSASYVQALSDTQKVISGKWKLPIIGSLLYGKKRFKELEREILNITPRMLSKELKDLEMHGMINRIVHDSMPVIVEYELTKSGKSFSQVMDIMVEWGLQHRKCLKAKVA